MKSCKNDIFKFLIYTYLGSWLIWSLGILNSNNIIKLTISNEALNHLGTYIPSITGIIFTYLYGGIKEVKKLLFMGIKIKFNFNILFFYIIMPVILTLSFLVTRYFCRIKFNSALLTNPVFIFFAFFYILILGGPIGEEFGWRGFLLNRLFKFYRPFESSIVLGFIWAFWHLPLFFLEGSAQSNVNFIGYMFATIFLSIIMTVLFIRTERSILSVILFHTISNLSFGVFPIYSTVCGGLIILSFLTIITIIVILLNKDLLLNFIEYDNL